MSCKHN